MIGRLLALAALIWAPAAYGAPGDVKMDELVIALKADAKTRELIDAEDDWEDACDALARGFVRGTGPWRLGPFKKATCRDVAPAPAAGRWQLLVAQTGKQATLTVRFGEKVVATTDFEGAEWTLVFLQDATYAKLLALALLDQMPALGRAGDARKAVDGDERGTESALPEAPPRLMAYELGRDEARDLWRPRSVGAAIRVASDDPKAPPRWRTVGKGKLAADAFVHAEAGRGAYADATAKRLKDRHAKLTSRFASLAGKVGLVGLGEVLASGTAAGYFGVRYGHSFFQGPVIRKMSFVGLLLELRGAPLDGLRLYYDVWPKALDPVESGATSFDARRLVVGWSFGGALGPFDRIDVTPKIGRWSVSTSFTVPLENLPPETVEFNLDDALSVGLEGGLEMRFGRMLTRGWVARDFDVDVGKSQDTSVVDTRMGLDALIRGPWFSMSGMPTNLSFLAFTFYESVQLTRDAAAAAGQVSIDAVKYDVGYIGGGIALSY